MTEVPPAGALAMARRPARPALTADQQADAERLRRQLTDALALAGDLRTLAATLAAPTDTTIFGATEFAVRDLVRGLAAKALEAARADRGKTSRPAAAPAARPVPKPPGTSGGRAASPSPSSARSA